MIRKLLVAVAVFVSALVVSVVPAAAIGSQGAFCLGHGGYVDSVKGPDGTWYHSCSGGLFDGMQWA